MTTLTKYWAPRVYDYAPVDGNAREVRVYLAADVEAALKATEQMDDAASFMWMVLANVSGGDWDKQSSEWQAACQKARDDYFEARRLLATAFVTLLSSKSPKLPASIGLPMKPTPMYFLPEES